jgi:hypothetical protein
MTSETHRSQRDSRPRHDRGTCYNQPQMSHLANATLTSKP